jgi:hypothetical protein
MNLKTTTLAMIAIVAAVALVTANGLTSASALKGVTSTRTGVTAKPVSSTTANTIPKSSSGPLSKFISCVKTVKGELTQSVADKCYGKAYTSIGTTTAKIPHSNTVASDLIPIVGMPTAVTGHAGHGHASIR